MRKEIKGDRVILTADGGNYITNGKVYGRKILLAKGESGEDYKEITKEEYDKIIEDFENSEVL